MSRRSIRRLTTAFAAAAALLVPCAGTGTAAAADSATSPRATVTVDAPASVAAGKPITVRIGVRGARDVGGYETSLLFDQSAAQFSGARHAGNSVARTGRGVQSLGPVELDRGGASFGFYSCPVKDCATGKGPRRAAGASGRVALGKVTVVPNRVGVLELRFARTKVVDTRGRTVAVRPALVVRVRVGKAAAQIFRAPKTIWRATPLAVASKNLRTADLNRDRAVSNTDAQDAAYRWTMRRYGAGPCAPGRVAADVNRDGCVDVADVQAIAAAYTKPVKRLPAPPLPLPAPLVDPMRVPSFGVGPALAALLPANITFTVDSTADAPDANTTDGICRTAANVCTLRAAIESANVRARR